MAAYVLSGTDTLVDKAALALEELTVQNTSAQMWEPPANPATGSGRVTERMRPVFKKAPKAS